MFSVRCASAPRRTVYVGSSLAAGGAAGRDPGDQVAHYPWPARRPLGDGARLSLRRRRGRRVHVRPGPGTVLRLRLGLLHLPPVRWCSSYGRRKPLLPVPLPDPCRDRGGGPAAQPGSTHVGSTLPGSRWYWSRTFSTRATRWRRSRHPPDGWGRRNWPRGLRHGLFPLPLRAGCVPSSRLVPRTSKRRPLVLFFRRGVTRSHTSFADTAGWTRSRGRPRVMPDHAGERLGGCRCPSWPRQAATRGMQRQR